LEQLFLKDKRSCSLFIRKLNGEKKYDQVIDIFERLQQVNPIFKDKKFQRTDKLIYNDVLRSLYFMV
jgi:hypothetical protein